MRAKRLIVLLGPLACMFFVFLFMRISYPDREQPYRTGEFFRFGALRPNQEIVVTRLYSHGKSVAREYRFRGDQLMIFDTEVAWRDGRAVIHLKEVLVARTLSADESDGLNAAVEYFRERKREPSSSTREIRITYLRDGQEVGSEFYIGFSLTTRLADYAAQGFKGHPGYSPDYDELAKEHGISRARLDRIVPFEELEWDPPNKTPELTEGAAMPRADARRTAADRITASARLTPRL